MQYEKVPISDYRVLVQMAEHLVGSKEVKRGVKFVSEKDVVLFSGFKKPSEDAANEISAVMDTCISSGANSVFDMAASFSSENELLNYQHSLHELTRPREDREGPRWDTIVALPGCDSSPASKEFMRVATRLGMSKITWGKDCPELWYPKTSAAYWRTAYGIQDVHGAFSSFWKSWNELYEKEGKEGHFLVPDMENRLDSCENRSLAVKAYRLLLALASEGEKSMVAIAINKLCVLLGCTYPKARDVIEALASAGLAIRVTQGVAGNTSVFLLACDECQSERLKEIWQAEQDDKKRAREEELAQIELWEEHSEAMRKEHEDKQRKYMKELSVLQHEFGVSDEYDRLRENLDRKYGYIY